MIDIKNFFETYKNKAALWCNANCDSGDLARCAEFVVANKVRMLSVVPDSVATVWPWLEQEKIKILSRVYVADKKITEKDISDITKIINDSFKHGARGAQVFVPINELENLVDMTYLVKDDLFFDKDLVLGLDIMQINPFDWQNVFENLQKINASALMLVLLQDDGMKSDFVGRIYGMINAWNEQNKFDLHFLLGPDSVRIEQVLRLMEKLRPELIKNVKFFVKY